MRAVLTLNDLRPALLAGTKARWMRRAFGQASIRSDAWVERLLPDGRHERVEFFEDYSGSNRLGSRGVTRTFMLADGRYLVSEPVAFWVVDQYEIRVENGKITRENTSR